MTREAAIDALLSVISGAYAWVTPPSRRLVMWDQVPKTMRPAAYLFDGRGEQYDWIAQRATPRRTIILDFVVYIDGSNATIGSTQISGILDAMNAALLPRGQDLISGRNTLGGLAYSCRIDGTMRTHPGDIDGDGLIWGPIKIVLP